MLSSTFPDRNSGYFLFSRVVMPPRFRASQQNPKFSDFPPVSQMRGFYILSRVSSGRMPGPRAEPTAGSPTHLNLNLISTNTPGEIMSRTPNDDRSDSMNPNNDAYDASMDNHANQLNPNNEAYQGSNTTGDDEEE
jgi:hypothetical protein